MPQQPRLNLPGIPQHIIQRGNNRQPCFKNKKDFKVYLVKLKEYAEKYNVAIHSFVLMTNHVHILATPGEEHSISQMMQSLGRYYVRYFNHQHQRTGTLWEGRFKSCLVETDAYFLAVSRYIELNPVRAKMVNQPDDYPWSSYHCNAYGKPYELITHHPTYLGLSRTVQQRLINYQKLFEGALPQHQLDSIRSATNKNGVLGSELFTRKIEIQTGQDLLPKPLGGDRRSAAFRGR